MAFFDESLAQQDFGLQVEVTRSKQVDSATALASIQEYLQNAETSMHLHPDCTFDEHGLSRHTSEKGIVLQLLDRMQRGLNGERIIAELEGTDEDLEPLVANDTAGDALNNDPHDGLDEEERAALQSNAAVNKSYNEQMLEQGEDGIVEGEIGARSNLVGDVAHQP